MSNTLVRGEKVISGGFCLGHGAGRTIFLSGLIPSETAEVEIVDERAGHLFARPIRIVEPSPDRREPFCPYRLSSPELQCGGCDWQHIAYDRQPLLKKEIFIDCLRRIGKVTGDIEIEVYTSPDRNYRHRAQFKIDHRHNTLGFFRSESHDIVSMDTCPILTDSLNRFLVSARREFSAIPSAAAQIKVIAGDDDRIALSPVLPGISNSSTRISVGTHVFEIGGAGFFQQNRFLLQTMGTWADAGFSGDRCVDLFGGCGFFSVFLANRFSRGLLVERDASLMTTSRRNFELNGIGHFAAEAMDAERFIAGGKVPVGPADCVVIDPPRTGCSPALLKGLAAARPRQILSISCDPATHARDLLFLQKHGGYSMKRAAVFDLYPHTHHIETAVLLGASS